METIVKKERKIDERIFHLETLKGKTSVDVTKINQELAELYIEKEGFFDVSIDYCKDGGIFEFDGEKIYVTFGIRTNCYSYDPKADEYVFQEDRFESGNYDFDIEDLEISFIDSEDEIEITEKIENLVKSNTTIS